MEKEKSKPGMVRAFAEAILLFVIGVYLILPVEARYEKTIREPLPEITFISGSSQENCEDAEEDFQ